MNLGFSDSGIDSRILKDIHGLHSFKDDSRILGFTNSGTDSQLFAPIHGFWYIFMDCTDVEMIHGFSNCSTDSQIHGLYRFREDSRIHGTIKAF